MDLTMATERGKIGRLTNELRDQVNALIRDNTPACDIITFLESKNVEGITPQNISTWKRFGYDKWVANQQRMQDMKARMEFAGELARECGGADGLATAGDAAAQLAMNHITAALEAFTSDQMQQLLCDKPEKILGLIDTLSNMRAVDLKFAEYRRKVKAAVDQVVAVAEEKGSATADDIKSIFATAYGV